MPTVAPTFEWTDATGDNSFSDAANWTNLRTSQVATSPPPQGSSLTFDGTVSNADISGVQGFGQQGATDFGSITLTNGYTGTVSFASNGTMGISVNNFTLDSGAIAQPTAGTDLTVLGNFTWTGGTLNSSTNLANVNIDGSTATAIFAPASGGTVNLGSNINLDHGAVATLQAGILNVTNNGQEFNINANSGMLVDPGVGKSGSTSYAGNVTFGAQVNIVGASSWFKVNSGSYISNGSLKNSGGSFILMPDTFASFFGTSG